MGENFRESSKKTNFTNKTFVNRPKNSKEENFHEFRGLVRQPLWTWPYQSMCISTCVNEMETYILKTVMQGNHAYKELWELALSPCLQL